MISMKRYIWILVAGALGLSGCLRDDFAECPVVPGGKTAATTISLAVPGAPAAATRSDETDAIETHIEELSLLLVNTSNGSAIEEHITIGLDELDQSGDYKSFKVDLPAPSSPLHKYKIILVANVNNIVENALSASTGYESSFMSLLEGEMNGQDVVGMPMWGETESTFSLPAANVPTIQMIKTFAKMSFSLAPDVAKVFTLTNALFCNEMQEFRVAPWKSGTTYNYSHADRKVTALSIPEDATVYEVWISAQDMLSGLFYTPEKQNTSENEAYFLVKGEYGPDKVEGWYKLRLLNKQGELFDFYRNHHYAVTIRGITGPGYFDYDDARNGNTYLQAEVVEWNESAQNVIFDGNYFLKVSHTNIDLYGDLGHTDITVETNFPGSGDKTGNDNNLREGAFLASVAGNGWLTVSEIPGGTNFLKTIRITWPDYSSGTNPRTASFTVKAGNMSYTVNVTQNPEPWLTATPERVSVLDGMYHQMGIRSACRWNVHNIQGHGNGTEYVRWYLTLKAGSYDVASDKVIYQTTLDEHYNEDRMGYVTFEFKEEDYNYPPKYVRLWLASGTLVEEANSYILKPHETIVIPARDIEAAGSMWSWSDDDDSTGSTIVWTDDDKVLTGFGGVATVKTAGTGNDGAFVRVRAGEGAGNTIVGITASTTMVWSWHIWTTPDKDIIEKGVKGDGAVWMDRNLGAMASSPTGNVVDTYGLYYQYGRKDPFPAYQRPYWVFDEGLQTYTPDAPIEVDSREYSDNPRPEQPSNRIPIFDIALSSPFRVLTSGYSYWSQPWENGTGKTMSDPCPPGWRVPVSDLYTYDVGDGNFETGQWGMEAASDEGVVLSKHGGFYPFTGFRDPDAGTNDCPVVFSDPDNPTGMSTHLWTADSGYSEFRIKFVLSRKAGNPSVALGNIPGSQRKIMGSIRCVKE